MPAPPQPWRTRLIMKMLTRPELKKLRQAVATDPAAVLAEPGLLDRLLDQAEYATRLRRAAGRRGPLPGRALRGSRDPGHPSHQRREHDLEPLPLPHGRRRRRAVLKGPPPGRPAPDDRPTGSGPDDPARSIGKAHLWPGRDAGRLPRRRQGPRWASPCRPRSALTVGSLALRVCLTRGNAVPEEIEVEVPVPLSPDSPRRLRGLLLPAALLSAALAAAPAWAAQGDCGQPQSTGTKPTASDCACILKVSVKLVTCELCVCDVNNSTNVSSTDALQCLRKAVSLPVTLNCPPVGQSPRPPCVPTYRRRPLRRRPPPPRCP